jgi:hypothetical protein
MNWQQLRSDTLSAETANWFLHKTHIMQKFIRVINKYGTTSSVAANTDESDIKLENSSPKDLNDLRYLF